MAKRKLSWYQKCVGRGMKGYRGGERGDKFRSVAKACAKQGR